MKIGDNYITKEVNNNGVIESSRIKNDTFAQIVGSRTFLPIRIVLEAFGASVSWDGVSKNVIVNTSGAYSSGFTAEQIYSKYSSAVFYIEIFDTYGEILGSGSGFFINSNGTAITNYHVIEGASSAKITTTDGRSYDVEGVYGFDKAFDVAKIKVSGSGFPCVNISSSSNVVGGSVAFAIGSPLGLDNTISEGIVSNPNRIIEDMSYYQITTPISPGSSGGALFDKYGNVIGITSGGFVDGQNLNVATPISSISKLSGITLTKLSTVVAQEVKDNVTLSLSDNDVALNVGDRTDIMVSFANYDHTVGVEYITDDKYVVGATWGEWNGNRIPLTINAIGQESTTIKINLYDDTTNEYLASKTINVSVSEVYSTPYYSGFYPAPDLGAIFGVPVYFEYEPAEGMLYYYTNTNLQKVSPTGDYIADYSSIVIENGFYYDSSFYDDDGNLVMLYINPVYGLNLFTGFADLSGVSCYTVMTLWD